MQITSSRLPQARRIRVGASLSREARLRLRWMACYLAHGRNARKTYEHFGISSATFYRWWHRYDPRRLQSLEDDRRTRRPRRVRLPQTPPDLVAAIRRVREAYPRWGKIKLAVLLRREGWTVSASTVGRTLTRLRAVGQLVEPPVVRAQQARRRWRPRIHARRKPWEYVPQRPGDLVAIDSTPIEVQPGLRRVHFTVRDLVSRKDVLVAPARASSWAARDVLQVALRRMGFPIRAIQIDGGSEFKALFEAACQALGIALYVLPPRSPKLNAHVERAQRTHQEEFYDLLEEIPESIPVHNALLREWEESTTPSGRTRPWAISPRMSSSHSSHPDKRGKVFRIYWTSAIR